jgi:hypothetical protein
MKRFTVLLMVITICFNFAEAQSILRYTPSTGAGQVYTSLDTAYDEALDDDILYLSGNTFQFSYNAVDKRLQWIGAGVHSDSTMATGVTEITPTNNNNVSFIIHPSAGGSDFSGISFGGFRLNDCDIAGNIALVTFSRCKFRNNYISLSFTSNFQGSALHYRFQECIFDTFVTGNGFQIDALSNITFDHCLFGRGLFRLRTGVYTFNNCVFWASAVSDWIQQNSGCAFNNSIFWDGAESSLMGGNMNEGNIFSNCVFSHETIPVGGSGANPTIVSNCIANVTMLFVNTNENYTYEDGDDYHLVPGSPAITAASDGGQCGIYGGANPAKQGLVPFNPHISSAIIDPSTVNGTLNISITTTSQPY